jgi:hypothetical protein
MPTLAFVLRLLALAAALAAGMHAAAEERRLADFGEAHASADAVETADWVVRTGDHRGAPFVIVDKVHARMYVFERGGMLLGDSTVLLGLARGDYSVPGIGERPMSAIHDHERTTPAGRFIAEPSRNARGEDIVWVDFDASVAMHRVREVHPHEHRLQRLATPATLDKRISYGCINVPIAFYDRVLQPAAQQHAVIYVLPESMPAREWFHFGEAADAASTAAAAPLLAAHVRLYEPGPSWVRLDRLPAEAGRRSQ